MRAAVRELERHRDTGRQLWTHDDVTLAQWLDHWLETVLPMTARWKTLSTYRSQMRLHVIPALGAWRLTELRPEHFEEQYRIANLDRTADGDNHRSYIPYATDRARLRPSKETLVGDVITLQGIIPAIATPFQPDGSLDEEALRRLVRFEIEAGVGGLIPTGSTGEFFSLTHEERKRVVEVVSSEADGAVPVIPHTGALTTRETVELSQHAEQNGASALMVIPPYYEPLAWDELLAHYQAVSDAVSIPIIYYHMPAATGLEVTPEQFDELAQIENIRYTKDSTGNAVELLGLFKALKGKLSVLNGEDKLTFLAFASGAKGGVWGSATFFPSLAVELYDALVTNQDLVKARGVWDRIWTILDTLGEASYQGAVKAGLDIVGVPVGQTRLPIKPASKEYYTKLRGVLRDAGVDVVG